MKLKNKVFENGFIASLQKLIGQDLPVKMTYSLVKLVKEVNDKSVVYREAKQKIFDKYAEKQGDNLILNPATEDGKKGTAKLDELLQLEETYEIEKIKLPDDVKLSVQDVMLLEEVLVIK